MSNAENNLFYKFYKFFINFTHGITSTSTSLSVHKR